MADDIVVAGVGAVGGFGCGVEELTEAALCPKGPNAEVEVKMPDGTKRSPAYLADTEPLKDIVRASKLRRVDNLSRIATLAVHLALEDAGAIDEKRDRLGVILATGNGAHGTTFRFMESCIEHGDSGASPIIFSGSGNSGPLSNLTILLGVKGPVLTVCQPQLAATMAYTTACCWLRDEIADAVAVGAAEEYIPLIGYARQVLFRDENKGPIHPFDFENQSSVVGEGGAFTLLRRRSDADSDAPIIRDIFFDRWHSAPPIIPDEAEILTNADGSLSNAEHQRKLVEKYGDRCLSYTPAFGSMLTETAFHIAIAAAQLRRMDKSLRSRSPRYCVEIFKDGQYGVVALE